MHKRIWLDVNNLIISSKHEILYYLLKILLSLFWLDFIIFLSAYNASYSLCTQKEVLNIQLYIWINSCFCWTFLLLGGLHRQILQPLEWTVEITQNIFYFVFIANNLWVHWELKSIITTLICCACNIIGFWTSDGDCDCLSSVELMMMCLLL